MRRSSGAGNDGSLAVRPGGPRLRPKVDNSGAYDRPVSATRQSRANDSDTFGMFLNWNPYPHQLAPPYQAGLFRIWLGCWRPSIDASAEAMTFESIGCSQHDARRRGVALPPLRGERQRRYGVVVRRGPRQFFCHSLRSSASCSAARKPHGAHIFHSDVTDRVAVIIRMRRSIADTRENSQRSDSFPKTNRCLAMAPKA